MRKLLLITTALVGFAAIPDRAEAAPVGAWVAGTVFGLGATTAGFAIVSGVVSMAISIGLSMVAMRLRGKPKTEAIRTELTRPTSLPPYRFVYGKTWAPGTPVAWQVVGKILYVCYLLNSRPSAGPFTVLFDKRTVEKTGDEFDFSSGGGADATNAPFAGHVRYWIGDGTQTQCPAQIASESGGGFSTTDRWRGRTVLWARLDCGDDEDRSERWPTTPPELNVDGNWSLVMDPRDGQEKFSRNQALCVLDALTRNPLRPYGSEYLRADTFAWAADVADQAVAVKGGGFIPRYRCDGVLVFDDGSELEDQIQPLLDAGASRLTRIGGKLAMVPTAWRPSVKTITDVTDGQPLELIRWRSSDELFTEGVARFPAPDRAYESAETPVHIVPGAQAEDGGTAKRLSIDLDFVSDHRQAQRLAKIAVMRSRMQRQVNAELFSDCFDLVAGSVCRLSLPAPYGAWTGKYEVENIAPAAGLNDDDSVTIRLPAVLTETSDDITAWDAETEEKDMVPGDFTGTIGRILPPGVPVLTTGSPAARTSGDTTIAGVIAAWTGSPSSSVIRYEWQWFEVHPIPMRGRSGGGELGVSAADGDGVYSVSLPWVEPGEPYRVRVRSVGSYGRSDWVEPPQITALGPEATIPVPGPIAANAVGTSSIDVSVTQANHRDVRRLLIYGNDINNSLTASPLWTVDAAASVPVTRRETGLGTGATRYYFARARDQWGNLSGFTDSASATTA